MLRAPSVTSRYDLSSVSSAVVGATALSKEVALDFDSLFPGCKLIQGYGLTETTVAVTLTNPADNVFCSCGSLFPGCEGKLMDEDGREIVDYGVPGELYVRSPTVMLGYLDNEAETKSMLSPDGWLRTGDLAEIRVSGAGHGHLFFIERVKELIKVRVSHLLLSPGPLIKPLIMVLGHASSPHRAGILPPPTRTSRGRRCGSRAG